MAGAAFTPDLYTCVVSVNGVSDIPAILSDIEDDAGEGHWVVAYWDRVISDGNFDKNHLEAISPINYVEAIQAPNLLLHAEYDKIVPQSQSKSMYKVMKSANKDVIYKGLRFGDHSLTSAQNRMDAMKAIEEFVKKNV